MHNWLAVSLRSSWRDPNGRNNLEIVVRASCVSCWLTYLFSPSWCKETLSSTLTHRCWLHRGRKNIAPVPAEKPGEKYHFAPVLFCPRSVIKCWYDQLITSCIIAFAPLSSWWSYTMLVMQTVYYLLSAHCLLIHFNVTQHVCKNDVMTDDFCRAVLIPFVALSLSADGAPCWGTRGIDGEVNGEGFPSPADYGSGGVS